MESPILQILLPNRENVTGLHLKKNASQVRLDEPEHPRHYIPHRRDRRGPVVPLRLVELHPAGVALVSEPQEDHRELPAPRRGPRGQVQEEGQEGRGREQRGG